MKTMVIILTLLLLAGCSGVSAQRSTPVKEPAPIPQPVVVPNTPPEVTMPKPEEKIITQEESQRIFKEREDKAKLDKAASEAELNKTRAAWGITPKPAPVLTNFVVNLTPLNETPRPHIGLTFRGRDQYGQEFSMTETLYYEASVNLALKAGDMVLWSKKIEHNPNAIVFLPKAVNPSWKDYNTFEVVGVLTYQGKTYESRVTVPKSYLEREG